ncbi:heterodisulfide reductase-related iron-sulfur binding cluster [uncultured Ilumatobacter sp.]|uniref:heterodisulfide reductase-related iron-sulfur binding cluster n=1 Tax=uncultured Ilumatobacter sp. TaxID=879968 RepID=UPI00374F0415
MTITYDPKHPLYLDEADVRQELTRVYDLCHGCRLCFKFCTSFPTLFEMIDRHDDHDAGRMTPAQQDQVVDECFQCKLCYVNCPYIPELHEWKLDFPRLMLRADAMQHQHGIKSTRSKVTTQVMGRTDLLGKAATTAAPVANKIVNAEPGSMVRKVTSKVTGVSAVRLLPPFAKQRFSTWFSKRPKVRLGNRQGRVTVYPTCLVEYQETDIGKDLVKVYERNGVECNNSKAGCCGAPWLHTGDIKQFTKIAEKNIATLAKEIRAGTDVVVPQPTCSYVLKKDYLDYVGGPDAELVAEHTYDAAEYLMKLHKADETMLDTDFDGETIEKITYHTPCHLRAQNIGFKSRDLMKLTGAKVKMVQQCSGIDGMWGFRAENEDISIPIAEKLGDMISKADGDAIAGDCHLANTAILEQTGSVPTHPLQVIARAYGIPEEH